MHGNRIEERVLRTSTALVDCYSGSGSEGGSGEELWSGLGQVLRIERTITNKSTGRITTDVAYAITSLSPERATPPQLLRAWREHWHIENKLHWVRDVTFDEDRSTASDGSITQPCHQPAAATRSHQHSQGLPLLRCSSCPSPSCTRLSPRAPTLNRP